MTDTATNPTNNASGSNTPLLRVRDLSVSFDNGKGPRVQAVDGVSMTVHPRQTLAVVGESGCGKSVSALSALQLVPRPPGNFDSGEILFDARTDDVTGVVDLLKLDAGDMRSVRGNDIAMIFQEPMSSLNPVFSVGDQIIEAITLHQKVGKKAAADAAARAMEDVGIKDARKKLKAYPHQFSGGMRQRVMIAMALACKPRLLLADEPTTALDVTIQAQILELIDDLKRDRDLGVMLITHDLGVVAENADVVCVMYAGRCVEYATAEALFDKPLHPYTRGLLASIPQIGHRRERLTTITDVTDDPSAFDVRTPTGDRRAWWPWHDPAHGVRTGRRVGGDSVLVEPEPDHWVAVWSQDASEQTAREPDLAHQRAHQGAPACAS